MAHRQHPVEAMLRASITAVIKVTGEQYKDLAAVTDLAPTLVSRRQRGVISWRISDIGTLAEHWHIRPGALFNGPDDALAALPRERVTELRRARGEELRDIA